MRKKRLRVRILEGTGQGRTSLSIALGGRQFEAADPPGFLPCLKCRSFSLICFILWTFEFSVSIKPTRIHRNAKMFIPNHFFNFTGSKQVTGAGVISIGDG